MDTPNEIEMYNPRAIATTVDSFSGGVTRMLEFLDLPTEGVLVEPRRRNQALNNVQSITEMLPANKRAAALYVSKFVAACAAGLFDAALNYLWNETISDLRQKVLNFDLDYFLDTAISETKRRDALKDSQDLSKLDDWELVRGCHLTGLISDIGFRHLDYVRDMRNYASAAHPNQNTLHGIQVASFLQTCIEEVLSKEPEGPVITVQRLLANLRTEVLAEANVAPIAGSLARMPRDLSNSLLRSIFGLYSDAATAASVKNNVLLVAPSIWAHSTEEARHELGLKYVKYQVNADVARQQLAYAFLENVDGLSYLPSDALALSIQTAVDQLFNVHVGINNFYNEPAAAAELAQLIPKTGAIPRAIEVPYVKTLIMCYIGNSYGVANKAVPIYEDLISRFSDRDMAIALWLPTIDGDVASRLGYGSPAERYRTLLREMIPRTASTRLRQILKTTSELSEAGIKSLASSKKYKTDIELLF